MKDTPMPLTRQEYIQTIKELGLTNLILRGKETGINCELLCTEDPGDFDAHGFRTNVIQNVLKNNMWQDSPKDIDYNVKLINVTLHFVCLLSGTSLKRVTREEVQMAMLLL